MKDSSLSSPKEVTGFSSLKKPCQEIQQLSETRGISIASTKRHELATPIAIDGGNYSIGDIGEIGTIFPICNFLKKIKKTVIKPKHPSTYLRKPNNAEFFKQ